MRRARMDTLVPAGPLTLCYVSAFLPHPALLRSPVLSLTLPLPSDLSDSLTNLSSGSTRSYNNLNTTFHLQLYISSLPLLPYSFYFFFPFFSPPVTPFRPVLFCSDPSSCLRPLSFFFLFPFSGPSSPEDRLDPSSASCSSGPGLFASLDACLRNGLGAGGSLDFSFLFVSSLTCLIQLLSVLLNPDLRTRSPMLSTQARASFGCTRHFPLLPNIDG
jgi:hypothetical protein